MEAKKIEITCFNVTQLSGRFEAKVYCVNALSYFILDSKTFRDKLSKPPTHPLYTFNLRRGSKTWHEAVSFGPTA